MADVFVLASWLARRSMGKLNEEHSDREAYAACFDPAIAITG
jgi:hypothetical protein